MFPLAHDVFHDRSTLFLFETLVDGLKKPTGSPPTGLRSARSIVIHRLFGRFDLLQSHAFGDHLFDAVSNDLHHIAVIRDIGNVTHSSMARDYSGAAFTSKLRNRDIEDM